MQTLLTNHGTTSTSTISSSVFPSSVSQPTLIALDLPGHGGSQGLPRYGPDEVLECVFRFVCLMRERYLKEAVAEGKKGRVVLVGHDWYVCSCSLLRSG